MNTKVKYARETVALALKVVLELCNRDSNDYSLCPPTDDDMLNNISDFCKKTLKEIDEAKSVSKQ